MINITIGSVFNTQIVKEIIQDDFNFSFFGAPANFPLDGGRIVNQTVENYLNFTNFLYKKK